MAKYNISSIIKEKLKNKEKEERQPDENISIGNTEEKSDQKENQHETNQNEKEIINNNDIKNISQAQEKVDSVDIISELKNIESNFLQNDYVDAPEELNLSTIEVPNKTDDDLISEAKNSLEQKYSNKKDTTNQNFEKQIEKILLANEAYKKSTEDKRKEINNIYDSSIKETENQALKRGLARSSIIIGQISNLEENKAKELVDILNELDKNLTENETEIANLEKEKDNALTSLDIEYAIELDEKIQALNDKYNKAKQDAIEFNNNVSKLQAEYKLNLEKQKQNKQKQLTELENKYGSQYTKDLIKTEQFNFLKNYFNSIDKNTAISMFLTNKELKNILGDRYAEMYQYLKSM